MSKRLYGVWPFDVNGLERPAPFGFRSSLRLSGPSETNRSYALTTSPRSALSTSASRATICEANRCVYASTNSLFARSPTYAKRSKVASTRRRPSAAVDRNCTGAAGAPAAAIFSPLASRRRIFGFSCSARNLQSIGKRIESGGRISFPRQIRGVEALDTFRHFHIKRPLFVEGAATQSAQTGRMVRFISGQIFGKRTNPVIDGLGGDIGVKGEGSLFIANSESQRLAPTDLRVARFLLSEHQRTAPVGRRRSLRLRIAGSPARGDFDDVLFLDFRQGSELGRNQRPPLLAKLFSQPSVALRRLAPNASAIDNYSSWEFIDRIGITGALACLLHCD